jgi:hypothetical protein
VSCALAASFSSGLLGCATLTGLAGGGFSEEVTAEHVLDGLTYSSEAPKAGTVGAEGGEIARRVLLSAAKASKVMGTQSLLSLSYLASRPKPVGFSVAENLRSSSAIGA